MAHQVQLPRPNRMSLLLVTSLCTLTIGVSGCMSQDRLDGVSSDSQDILGGTPITAGQYPTVVAILVDNGRRGMCTGTLIAPDIVLTAAHCIHTQTLGYATQAQLTAALTVVFDGENLQAGQFGPTRSVSESIPHPGFTRPTDPDVGIIRLATPITDRTPTPVNLNAEMAPIGISLTMVGYGQNDTGSALRGMVLKDKKTVSCTQGVNNGMFLCFNQTDGTGKCQGDSGGPSFAMINGVQTVVGITSFGDQNCQQFGADMRVDASRDFLAEHAPEVLCADDGVCEDSCGANGMPVDPNCSNCIADNDCDNSDHFCDGGFCMPTPLTPGGLGSPCGDGEPECASGLCGTGADGNRCTDTCTMGGTDCPTGFDCIAAGDGGACWPSADTVDDDDGGGCRSGGPTAPMVAFILLAGLIAVRQRRRSRS